MDDWLADDPQCFNILSFALAALLRNKDVYFSGGGFGCAVVTNLVLQWFNKGAAGHSHLELLKARYKINLMGIFHKNE